MTAAKTEPVTLPDKPSDLLTVALDELELRERDPRYQIDMGDWVTVRGGVCHACLAGLGFLRILGIDAAEEDDSYLLSADEVRDVLPELSEEDAAAFADRIASLNELRMGECWDAFRMCGLDTDEAGRFRRDVTRYADDPAAFKSELRQLAADLKEGGY